MHICRILIRDIIESKVVRRRRVYSKVEVDFTVVPKDVRVETWCTDMYTDMSVETCNDMPVGMCADICADIFADIRVDMGV